MLVEEPVVLAVGARPGTAECLCAGTLALLKQRGWRVALASMTPGDGRMNALSPKTTANLRHAEARASAAVLDGEYRCLESADFTIVYGDELCRRTTALLRAVRPAVVLTHGPQDDTPDHEETGRTVRQACLAAPVEGYDTPSIGGSTEPTGRIPHLYYLDPLELIDILGRPVEPTLIVDISAAMDTKTKMLAQHAGQTVWTRGQPGVDQQFEAVRAWSRQRGEQIGCAFGEGFRQHLGHGYPRDSLLKQVLGPLSHEVG